VSFLSAVKASITPLLIKYIPSAISPYLVIKSPTMYILGVKCLIKAITNLGSPVSNNFDSYIKSSYTYIKISVLRASGN